MSTSKPTTFGATIVQPTSDKQQQPQQPTTPHKPLSNLALSSSPALSPSPSQEDITRTTSSLTPTPSHPAYSPFYDHDRSPLSRMASHTDTTPSKPTTQLLHPTSEKDLESGFLVSTLSIPRDPESPFTTPISIHHGNSKECGMWPSKATLLRGRLAEKRRKRDGKWCGGYCGPVLDFWAARSKRQRLGIKLALAIVVIGLAVTIGLCISIAVHGSVYAGHGQENGIQVPGQQ